ncbi:hypothetical protein OF001_U190056 [Pseudomonas sp. OF001]|nr:hypothetical protein OF001_U190056 [Pseudomonas sp. OF001]
MQTFSLSWHRLYLFDFSLRT